jgi:uncharacterized protein
MTARTNRLAKESSPYLRQHASNPVDWFPWGDEAFAKAEAENKPVFLSIGYSSCHWCHVMEHESFERDDVAAIMNDLFVCIKVDREEHPDLDALYMTATQLMTQRGGWPNSVWLTPDRRPWYAGTYFPREDRPGRIGFKTLLTRLGGVWKERKKDVEEQATVLTEAIRKQHEANPSGLIMELEPESLLTMIQQQFIQQFDARYGGFGDAPKFPPHSSLLLLLRIFGHHPVKETETVITRTLNALLRGGIYDQIGGGFHRYSTDERWLVPHFEKMLYDNALLLNVFAKAYGKFQFPAYRRVAVETAAWLKREMTHPEGGFYSALDADSDGEEGKFYTWSHVELSRLLDEAALKNLCVVYNILPGGNFSDEASGHPTGLNIPHVNEQPAEPDIEALAPARAILLNTREKRVHPGLDNKIIASWNGLMISALASAGTCLNHPPFIKMAENARSFVEKNLIIHGRLRRCWLGTASDKEGVLEDYAAMALADLDLYEATGQKTHLTSAMRFVGVIRADFYDGTAGELFMTGRNAQTPLIRLKDVFDQGSPSGIGLAVQAFMRLGIIQNDNELLQMANQMVRRHQSVVQRMPSAVSSMIEGYVIGLDIAPVTTTGHAKILFAAKPTEIIFDHEGNASLELQVTLPAQWHLNDVFQHASGIMQPLRIDTDSKDCIITEIKAMGITSWQITIQGVNTVKNLVLTVHYQPCSETACLAVAQQTIHVNVASV